MPAEFPGLVSFIPSGRFTSDRPTPEGDAMRYPILNRNAVYDRAERKAKREGIRVFVVYPTGDPYSRTWDASEYGPSEWVPLPGGGWHKPEQPAYLGWVFRGDLGHRFRVRELVAYLRRNYPGCKVYGVDY